MTKTKLAVSAFAMLFLALPALGKTYKYAYPGACSQMWGAVKDTLADKEEYAQVKIFDPEMKADYQPKHSVHVDITGTLMQRINHVTLVSKGANCEMQVVSNWSGWGHEDQGDFKKRVDATIAKPKTAEPAEPAKPFTAGK